jgi:ankyrin repeat protein
MTTTGNRRRYPTSDSDDDNGEILNSNPQLTNKRRVSAAADFAAHRSIVSERQQLAVLKQLTATDETSLNKAVSPLSSSSIIPQQRSTKIFRRNEHGETIAHIAARKGDLKQLKKALKDGANVNEEDNAGKIIIINELNRNFLLYYRMDTVT